MRKYLAASYDRSAETYDSKFREIQYNKYRSLINPVMDEIEGKTLLDVGCGTGLLFEYFVKDALNINYTGIDLSINMLLHAFEKKHGIYTQGDMYMLPVKNTSVDVVTSFTVINIFPDKIENIFSEFRRVMKPGGMLIMSILKENLDNEIFPLLDMYGFKLVKVNEAGQDTGLLCVMDN